MPRLQLGATLAHELCHAFLVLKGFPAEGLRAELVEGLCELFAHAWLSAALDGAAPDGLRDDAKLLLARMESNPDPVYGGGLRAARAALAGVGGDVPRLLRHVRRHCAWPAPAPGGGAAVGSAAPPPPRSRAGGRVRSGL